MLDEATVLQILFPACNHVTAFVKFVTCEVAISKRLFELFPRLNVVGRLPFLDLFNLPAAEEMLQQIYDTISDKPEKMIKYENATRPDGV